MMPLWDDATSPYTGQQSPQDSSSLWGWLTSLFSGQPTRNPFNRWDPVPPQDNPYWPRQGPANYTADMTVPSPAGRGTTPVYTGPGVDPSLYPGAANWPTGVPASIRVAPPSAFTAANPQQQALWQQASTPAGYAALTGGAGPAAAAAAAPATRPSFIPPPPPPKPELPPVIRGLGTEMPPGGGSTGWTGYGPGVPPPTSVPAWMQAPRNAMPPAGGSQGWAGVPGFPGSQSGWDNPTRPRPSTPTGRTVSDADLRQWVAQNPPGSPAFMAMLNDPSWSTADHLALQAYLGR